MGTKGTCKSTLAEGLARYLELLVKEEQSVEDEIGLIGDEEDPLVTRFSIASSIGSSGDGLDVSIFRSGCGLIFIVCYYNRML